MSNKTDETFQILHSIYISTLNFLCILFIAVNFSLYLCVLLFIYYIYLIICYCPIQYCILVCELYKEHLLLIDCSHILYQSQIG